MYKIGHTEKKKPRRKRRWLLLVLLGLILLGWVGYGYAKEMLKPETTISQSKAVTSKIEANTNKLQHYDLPNFSIDVPAIWKLMPREQSTFQTFTWQASEKGTNGQQLQIFEDTIPTALSVNRAQIVSGEGDHMALNGEASDNCIAYTKNAATEQNNNSAIAKWQNTDFRCDLTNSQRNVIGTSSTDGVNTVILRSPKTGQAHRYFFMYSTQELNPDYNAFYDALRSVKMQ